MDFYFTVLIATGIPAFLLLISFFIFLVRIFTGKSTSDPRYSPPVATVFHQLLHFDNLFDYLTDFSRRYGTFRLLDLNHSELYTVDPRNVEYILKTNFENYSKGQYTYTIVSDLFGDGIFAVDGDKWRKQRKLASYEFSTRVLRDFSCGIFRKNSIKLARIVGKFSEERTGFDIQDLLMKCALDSIFEVGFGVGMNCLEGSNEEGSAFIRAFDESNALVYWRYADFLWKIKRLLKVGSEARLRKNIELIDDFVYGLIRTKRERLHNESDFGVKDDILSRFLAESQRDPENMTDRYLRDIILSFIIAGKDTTANTLSWFFYMLCKHPLIQEKLFQQVSDQEISHHRNMNDFVSELNDGVLDNMHYLHTALTETLRLYPAVPIDGKCAEVDDVLPDGFKLNKGDGINYMGYAMGRMRNIWGEDAEEFRPERWLEKGIFRPESPFKFVAFHAGPRICLGKEFAYRQMKIIAMVLLRYFRFQLEEEKEVRYRTMFTLHVNGGLHLRAFSRN